MKNGYHAINPNTGLEEYVIPQYKIIESYALDLFREKLQVSELPEHQVMLAVMDNLKKLGFEIVDKDGLY